MENDIEILERSLTKNRQRQLLTTLILVLAGLVIFILPPRHGTTGQVYLTYFVAIFLIFTGLALGANTLRSLLFNTPPVSEILQTSPTEIVWVYHQIVQTMPYGIAVGNMTTLYFCMQDGKHRSIRVSLKDIPMLFSLLKQRLPHATFGYSDEKAFLFQTDPRLLWKESR